MNLAPYPQRRAFTLIEILVTVSIIVLLATILLAVGSSVHKNSQISSTRNELVALEGMIEQAQRENNLTVPTTLYDNDGTGAVIPSTAAGYTAPNANFVDILYRYPSTKDQLIKLAGTKLQISTATPSKSAILDAFGNPISFVPQGQAAATGWTAVTKDELRSSGPNGVTVWTAPNDTRNADDILSSDVPH